MCCYIDVKWNITKYIWKHQVQYLVWQIGVAIAVILSSAQSNAAAISLQFPAFSNTTAILISVHSNIWCGNLDNKYLIGYFSNIWATRAILLIAT